MDSRLPSQNDLQGAFELLQTQWRTTYRKDGKFWQFANALTAEVEFLNAYEERFGRHDAWLLAQKRHVGMDYQEAVRYFWRDDGQHICGMWNDDFGWWGVLSVRVHDDIFAAGLGPDELAAHPPLSVAYRCWQRIYKSTQYWTNEMARAGVVPYGAWNRVPPERSENRPGHVQNGVTNSLFLLLGVWLYEAVESLQDDALFTHEVKQSILTAVENSVQWFHSWVEPGDSFPRLCPATLNFAGERCGLVRNALYPLFPTVGSATNYQLTLPTLVSGVALAAFSAASQMEALGQPQAGLRKTAKALLDGMTANLLPYFFARQLEPDDLAEPVYVLQDPPFSFIYSGDPADTIAGKGVFMRYASQLDLPPELEAAMRSSAQFAWKTRGDGLQMKANWSTGSARQDHAVQFRSIWTGGHEESPKACLPGTADDYLGSSDLAWLPASDTYSKMLRQFIGLDALGAWLRLESTVSPSQSAPGATASHPPPSISEVGTTSEKTGHHKKEKVDKQMKQKIDDYKQAAQDLFSDIQDGIRYMPFKAQWPPPKPHKYGWFFNFFNFWKVGCAADTYTDYLVMALREGLIDKAEAQQFMKSLYDHYYRMISYPRGQGCMYDDYAWWGNVAVKAYDKSYDDIFGSMKFEYQAIAIFIWSVIRKGIPRFQLTQGSLDAWKNAQQFLENISSYKDMLADPSNAHPFNKKLEDIEPLFEGGAWQYDLLPKWKKDQGCCPHNPSAPIPDYKPQPPDHGGYQLSLMGGLCFLMGLRLKKSVLETQAETDGLYKFFHQWCFAHGELPKPENGNLVFYKHGQKEPFVAPNQGELGPIMIRARVPQYKNLVAGDNKVSYFLPNSCWGGDQGLWLGGLVDYLAANPDDADAQRLVDGIVSGVAKFMQSENVMEPWYPSGASHAPAGDTSDYAAGIGVYMRYLNHAYLHNTSVRETLNQTDGAARKVLLQTADVAVNHPINSNSGTCFAYMNRIATLTTAINVLSPSAPPVEQKSTPSTPGDDGQSATPIEKWMGKLRDLFS